MLFEYDKSFPGFLCACAEIFNTGDIVSNDVLKRGNVGDLFQDVVQVKSDDERSAKFWHRMAKHFSAEYMYKIMAAFLSDKKDADSALVRYMYKVYKGMLPQADVSDKDAMFEMATLY